MKRVYSTQSSGNLLGNPSNALPKPWNSPLTPSILYCWVWSQLQLAKGLAHEAEISRTEALTFYFQNAGQPSSIGVYVNNRRRGLGPVQNRVSRSSLTHNIPTSSSELSPHCICFGVHGYAWEFGIFMTLAANFVINPSGLLKLNTPRWFNLVLDSTLLERILETRHTSQIIL